MNKEKKEALTSVCQGFPSPLAALILYKNFGKIIIEKKKICTDSGQKK